MSSTAGRFSRHRSTVLIAGALVVALALVVVVRGTAVTRGAELDPDNPGPDGAQAVARVLDDQGVDVEIVRSAADLDAARLGSDTLVVVTSSSRLGTSATDRLQARVSNAGAPVLVVDPTSALLDVLGVVGDPSGLEAGAGLRGACGAASYDDLVLEVDTAAALPSPGSGLSCFEGALIVDADGLTLLGAGELMTNDQILRADNAAIALRLLGERSHLVWYVASADDQLADDGVSLSSLLPRWILPGLALLLLAGLSLVLWRGRRLGPLATEPLPVIVKAIETTRSRGRLYRKGGDRAHAATTLRAATRRRASERLRLAPSTDEATLVRDVARHVGLPETEIAALIGSTARTPGSDRDLIAVANDLAALEEEVRRS